MFELFDPNDEVQIRKGNHLPHWYQPGATYFVTFRTHDSIPDDVQKLWYRRRDDWLRRHKIDPGAGNSKLALMRLERPVRREFHETFSREFLESLDRGHGECLLKRPELSKVVADSFIHFDGDRYHMSDFVVMPNHVHLLFCLCENTEIEKQCYSWKKFTATQINRLLGRSGRFWQEESFDHLVRTPEQFSAIQRYIAENPGKANLENREYIHYSIRNEK